MVCLSSIINTTIQLSDETKNVLGTGEGSQGSIPPELINEFPYDRQKVALSVVVGERSIVRLLYRKLGNVSVGKMFGECTASCSVGTFQPLLNFSSLPNSPYIFSGIQKSLTQLTNSFLFIISIQFLYITELDVILNIAEIMLAACSAIINLIKQKCDFF